MVRIRGHGEPPHPVIGDTTGDARLVYRFRSCVPLAKLKNRLAFVNLRFAHVASATQRNVSFAARDPHQRRNSVPIRAMSRMGMNGSNTTTHPGRMATRMIATSNAHQSSLVSFGAIEHLLLGNDALKCDRTS